MMLINKLSVKVESLDVKLTNITWVFVLRSNDLVQLVLNFDYFYI